MGGAIRRCLRRPRRPAGRRLVGQPSSPLRTPSPPQTGTHVSPIDAPSHRRRHPSLSPAPAASSRAQAGRTALLAAPHAFSPQPEPISRPSTRPMTGGAVRHCFRSPRRPARREMSDKPSPPPRAHASSPLGTGWQHGGATAAGYAAKGPPLRLRRLASIASLGGGPSRPCAAPRSAPSLLPRDAPWATLGAALLGGAPGWGTQTARHADPPTADPPTADPQKPRRTPAHRPPPPLRAPPDPAAPPPAPPPRETERKERPWRRADSPSKTPTAPPF